MLKFFLGEFLGYIDKLVCCRTQMKNFLNIASKKERTKNCFTYYYYYHLILTLTPVT